MKIDIKDSAKRYLDDKLDGKKYIFLVADDGSNKFSNEGGSCSIGDKFKLVFTNDLDDKYNIPIDNDHNYLIYTAQYETNYFGDGLVLDLIKNRLVLKDNGGVLDSSVSN